MRSSVGPRDSRRRRDISLSRRSGSAPRVDVSPSQQAADLPRSVAGRGSRAGQGEEALAGGQGKSKAGGQARRRRAELVAIGGGKGRFGTNRDAEMSKKAHALLIETRFVSLPRRNVAQTLWGPLSVAIARSNFSRLGATPALQKARRDIMFSSSTISR